MPRPDESLYALTQGGYKAMLDLHGKPMIQWVIDALTGAPSVEKIVVVGLPVFTDLVTDKPLTIIPDQGEMLANFKSGVDELLKTNPNLQQVLACSSDIPTITSEHVEWMIQRVLESDDDLYYNVIERSVMETRFSGSKRTYLRLKDVEVCGGDLNAIRASMVDEEPQPRGEAFDYLASRQGPPRFAEVADGVYRGGQPSRRDLEALHALGVKTIIDLRREDEAVSRREEAEAHQLGLTFMHFPFYGVFGAVAVRSRSKAPSENVDD
jgi:GTP:adenosylcobinamide-phosphate guanylyltransferase